MARPVIDVVAANHFLQLLGKNGDARFRAFPHKHTPNERKARLGARKPLNLRELQLAQDAGLGGYLVINRGGDSKSSITDCIAYFAEFDGQEEADQLRQVQQSGLPEPSLIVRTGGGSLHFYWLLAEPMKDTAQWQADMKRLAAHLGSDKSVNDPSRVMRVPGCWYMDGNQRPVVLVELIHESPARFTRDQIISRLPAPQQAPRKAKSPQSPKQPIKRPTAASERTAERALDQLKLVPPRIPGTGTRDQYLRLLWGLAYILGSDDAGAVMASHSPEWAAVEDLAAKAAEAGGQITDGTFFELARSFGAAPLSTPAPQPASGKPAAKPQGAAQGDQDAEFVKEAHALRQALDEGIKAIDAMPDVAMRSVGLVQLRRNLCLQEKDFLTLVHQLAEHQEEAPPEDFDALLAYADSISTEPIIDDLLAVGLTLVAGEGGSGKSSVAYQLVEAVTTGSKLAGQFQAKQAPCLVVQLDESIKDASVKWRAMGFEPAKGLIHFLWRFKPMMFPELRAKVRSTGAKVVILDSLLKIAGGTISPKDAEFGLLIYRLNQLAAELDIAIVCIHHLAKADKTKKRAEVTKEDIYGSAYVFNGAADVWGYWGFREDGNPDPLFALKVLKNRSNLVEVNTTYEFEGSAEDHRISFRGMANRTITLDEIKTHRERCRAFLFNRPGTVFTAKQVSDHTGVGSAPYAKRLLTELYQARLGVDRKQLPSTGGRPPYGYFAVQTASTSTRISDSHKEVSNLSLSLNSLL